MAGLAEHRSRRARSSGPARPSRSPPTRPGSSTCRRASQAAERLAGDVRSARGQGRRRSSASTTTASAHEPNNLTAIGSLIAYRALRYGRHLDLIITDQHSYRSADPTGDRRSSASSAAPSSRACSPRRRWRSSTPAAPSTAGNPPAELRFGDATRRQLRARTRRRRRSSAPTRRPGSRSACASSTATWKIWGNSLGTLDWRADPQNLPAGLTEALAGRGYAMPGRRRLRRAPTSSAARSTTSCATRGSPASPSCPATGTASGPAMPPRPLPPKPFEPVGLSFVGGFARRARARWKPTSTGLPKDHPLRPLFLADRPDGGKPEWTFNMLLRHGVRSCLEYAKTRRPRDRRARSRIPSSHRTWSSSTWADTAMRRCG